MLTRNPGLLILLLFAVAAHASLMDRWFGRQPPASHIGFALLFAPILLVMLGEWIKSDASTPSWQRRGSALAALGALWHLLLDGASLSLLWQPAVPRGLIAGGAALGAAVMAWVLRTAWRGVVAPGEPPSDPTQPAGPGFLSHLLREARLFGSTPAVVCLIGLGMISMAALGLMQKPQAWPKLLGAAAFFALCGAVGVSMGLERRAMLLRKPSPFARFRPRWLQRALIVPTQEGLAQLGRKGATIYVWEDIRGVSLGEYQGSPAVFIELVPSPSLQRLARDGSRLPIEPAWLRRQHWNQQVQRTLADCDLLIMSLFTVEGPGVLAEQIGTLLCDYDARAKLPSAAAALHAFVHRSR